MCPHLRVWAQIWGGHRKAFSNKPRVFRFATHYLGDYIGRRRVRRTWYEGRSTCPHLGAWVQIWGGRRKALTTGPVCSASLHITRAVELASGGCAGLGTSLELRRRRSVVWVQICGGHQKAFSNVWSRIRPTRRRFRKEPKSGSDRSRWSFQPSPVPAILIRVAKNQKIQQDCARAQRRIQH